MTRRSKSHRRKRVSPLRAQRSALSRKRVSRKRVSRKRVSRKMKRKRHISYSVNTDIEVSFQNAIAQVMQALSNAQNGVASFRDINESIGSVQTVADNMKQHGWYDKSAKLSQLVQSLKLQIYHNKAIELEREGKYAEALDYLNVVQSIYEQKYK